MSPRTGKAKKLFWPTIQATLNQISRIIWILKLHQRSLLLDDNNEKEKIMRLGDG